MPIVGKWHGCEEFVNALGLGYVASQYTAEQYAIVINQALNTQLAKAAREDFVKNVCVMHAPKNVVEHYVDVFKKENQSVLSSLSKQETHFSANYFAAMQGVLLAKGQMDFVNVVESPFGGVYEINEFKYGDILQLIASECDNKFMNQYSYGLTNFKYKL